MGFGRERLYSKYTAVSLTTELNAFKKGVTVPATSFTTVVNFPLIILSTIASSAPKAEPCASRHLAEKHKVTTVSSSPGLEFMVLSAKMQSCDQR